MTQENPFSAYLENLKGDKGNWLSDKNNDNLSNQYPVDHEETDKSADLQKTIHFCFYMLEYDPLEFQDLTELSETELVKLLNTLVVELRSSPIAQQKFQPNEHFASFEHLVSRLEMFVRSFDLKPIFEMFREALIKGEDSNLEFKFEEIKKYEELAANAQVALTETDRSEENRRELAEALAKLQSFIARNKPLLLEKEELILTQRPLKQGKQKQAIRQRIQEIEELEAEGSVDLLYLTMDIKKLIANLPPAEYIWRSINSYSHSDLGGEEEYF